MQILKIAKAFVEIDCLSGSGVITRLGLLSCIIIYRHVWCQRLIIVMWHMLLAGACLAVQPPSMFIRGSTVVRPSLTVAVSQCRPLDIFLEVKLLWKLRVPMLVSLAL